MEQATIDVYYFRQANHPAVTIGADIVKAEAGDDLHQAVPTALINKWAGGMGLVSGRKAFQKPMAEGVQLLNAMQDVYLSEAGSVA